MGAEFPTQPGVAPQPGLSPRGRATLLLDPSAPPGVVSDGSVEGPPIVVPTSGAGAMPPKAVTQPPPWGAGAAHVTPAIPKGMPPHREREPSIEEISGSLLLPDASSELTAAQVEELSGSLLLEDPTDGIGPQVTRPPVPSSRPPGHASVKPPVPKSSKPPPAAHRALLGMPELPTTTPAPRMDLLPQLAAAPPMDFPPTVIVAESVRPGPVADVAVPAFPPQPMPETFPAQAPMQPSPGPMTGDIELTRLPRGGLQPMLDALGKLVERVRAQFPPGGALGTGGRPPWFLPAVAVAGLVVGTGIVGLVVSAVRSGTETGRARAAVPSATSTTMTTTTPKASPASTPTVTATPSPAPAPARAPVATSFAACTVSGTPHVIGPGATVAAGVEVVRLGDDLAIGFAPTEHDAIAVRVDPTSLNASATSKARSKGTIHRVTPILDAKAGLSLVVDAERKNDRLQGRRTVLADPPVQIGAAPGHVSWARVGGPPAGDLWPLDEGERVESLRGIPDTAGDGTIALAFRRGGAVWMGAATGPSGPAPKGVLSHVDGLGTAVGSPAVAIGNGVVMVAWSDRASTDDPWRLRWVRFDAGEAPGTPVSFTPPLGGKGEQAMSPSVAALPGGRFLLLWTEGPTSGHDLRGLTLTSEGKPLGAPLAISTQGVNAGQGQAAVNASGQGVVAFLESGSSGFQVAATSIACAP
jgi:hypothetical protein